MRIQILHPIAVFLLALAIFLTAPTVHSLDSRFSLLVSHNLMKHGSFKLNDEPAVARNPLYFQAKNFEVVNGNLFYLFPNASSVLSLPYVAAMNVFGVSVMPPDGRFDMKAEIRLQKGLASILMAGLISLIFKTARLWLPVSLSWLVALTAAFGTQIFSTASRALWSHTWGILLLGSALYLLARRERGYGLNPAILGTLLAWSYMVRPTFSVSILIVTVYLFLRCRQMLLPYALSGLCWLGIFLSYSWYNYGKLLPTYFAGGRLGSDSYWTALAGNLISPSRGVLVYSPFIVVVIMLVIIYSRTLVAPALTVHAALAIILHLLVISSFPHWWGGHSYGPRLMTDVIPWIALLAIFGIDALRNAWAAQRWKTLELMARVGRVFIVLIASSAILFSLFTHTRGAFVQETHNWNLVINVDEYPVRLWDWRQPQFLHYFKGW